MTRKEALLKLIALGPINRDEVHVVTCWPFVDVHNTIVELLNEGLIAWAHVGLGRRILILTARCAPRFEGWSCNVA